MSSIAHSTPPRGSQSISTPTSAPCAAGAADAVSAAAAVPRQRRGLAPTPDRRPAPYRSRAHHVTFAQTPAELIWLDTFERGDTENVEVSERRERARAVYEHLIKTYPPSPNMHASLSALGNYFKMERFAERLQLKETCGVTGLDLMDLWRASCAGQSAPPDTHAFFQRVRYAHWEAEALIEAGALADPKGWILARVAAPGPASVPENFVSKEGREKPRETRFGFKYSNALRALGRIRDNESVSLTPTCLVNIGEFAALVSDLIFGLPEPSRSARLDDIAILYDECITSMGDIVCGNGCTQRTAAVMQRELCSHLTPIELPTPCQFFCIEIKKFSDAHCVGGAQPSQDAIQSFATRAMAEFGATNFSTVESARLAAEIRCFCASTWDFVPTI